MTDFNKYSKQLQEIIELKNDYFDGYSNNAHFLGGNMEDHISSGNTNEIFEKMILLTNAYGKEFKKTLIAVHNTGKEDLNLNTGVRMEHEYRKIKDEEIDSLTLKILEELDSNDALERGMEILKSEVKPLT